MRASLAHIWAAMISLQAFEYAPSLRIRNPGPECPNWERTLGVCKNNEVAFEFCIYGLTGCHCKTKVWNQFHDRGGSLTNWKVVETSGGVDHEEPSWHFFLGVENDEQYEKMQ